jgi:hypothetical protein
MNILENKRNAMISKVTALYESKIAANTATQQTDTSYNNVLSIIDRYDSCDWVVIAALSEVSDEFVTCLKSAQLNG